jgi:hypothetical protein
MRLIGRLLGSGWKCMLVTRHSPRFIPVRHKDLKVVWMSSQKAENSIPPRREYVVRAQEDFYGEYPAGSVFVLDVFDCLATPDEEDFVSTLTMLRLMADKTAMTDSVLLVPVSSGAFSERQRAIIMRSGAEKLRF